jgi:hypothetical protein
LLSLGHRGRSRWRLSIAASLILVSSAAAQSTARIPLIETFNQRFRSADVVERIDAVRSLAHDSLADPALAASKEVAEALARGLQDPDDLVIREALEALATGRHPAAADAAVASFLSQAGKRLRAVIDGCYGAETEKLLETPKLEFCRACEILSAYLQPRGSESLITEARLFADYVAAADALGAEMNAVADALLAYGTKATVGAVVQQQLKQYQLTKTRPLTVHIDAKLREFCKAKGLKPADELADDLSEAGSRWQKWLDRNESKLPRTPAP